MLQVKELQGTLFFVALSMLLCLGTVIAQAQDLPEPWQSVDIGDVAAAGSATFESDVFTVKGSGLDIWDQDDSFHFVYQPAKGDCEISAYVSYVNITASDAKACVMIRDTLTATSSFAMAVTCGGPNHGTYFQRRPFEFSNCDHDNLEHGKPAPMWVKLVRAGNTITASMSEDGTTWDPSASATNVELGEDFYIGLGICAKGGNLGDLCEVTFENVVVDPGDVTSIEESSAFVSPEGYQLNQNYPNPFNPQTTIEYQLPEKTHVSLKVFDINGCEVSTIVNGEQAQGHHSIRFYGHSMPSGIYFYRLITNDQTITKRMVLLK